MKIVNYSVLSSLICWCVFLTTGCVKNITEDSFTINPEMTSIPADGLSTMRISGKFDNSLSRNQSITVTTSKGLLFRPPIGGSVTGVDVLSFKPFSDSFDVILQSGILVENEVFVTLTANNFSQTEVVKFTPSCPDQLFLDGDGDEISVQNGDQIELEVDFVKGVGQTSDQLRVDFFAEPINGNTNGLPRIKPNPAFISGGKATTVLTATGDSRGEYAIYAVLNNTDCSEQRDTFFVTINE